MKKQFTLAALGLVLMAPAAFGQTLDGQVLASEGYTQIGRYNSTIRGFGDHGLVALYAKTTATKVYVALTGALESNGNSFQIYMNHPRKNGVASGTALPKSNITGTSFQQNSPTMELTQTDYGFGVKGGTTNSASSIIDYTRLTGTGTAATATDQVTGNLPVDGTAVTVDAATTGGLNKTRMAFKNVFTLVGATPATPTHNGTQGWEIELDRADLDIQNGDVLQFFAAQNNDNGGYYSSDVIPEVTGNTTATNSGNLAANPNFVTLAGNQFVNYTAVITATQKAVAQALQFSVYPNPSAGNADVNFLVPSGQQEVELQVFNSVGQKVQQLSLGRRSGKQVEPLRNLQAGSYYVKLRVGDQVTSQLVAVQ
ncbi:T9SS type A sorting domain-containing protein [Hymenobacter sp. UYP22]|uniref:T9SS type A sorting domain-containing protein n=1 Tax=Hymenobacter sp. UYP22 TaxID=3156348 RepID=UPI003394A33E